MDSMLLAVCFIAMAVLVLAWAMLPHNASQVARRAADSSGAESRASGRVYEGQAA